MSLDLGALVGSVILNTAQFDQAYTRTSARMAELGATAEKSAAGTATLDEAYVATAASADKAAAAVGRTTAATRANGTAEESAALAATRHAEALGVVSGSMDRLALSTPRVQQAELRLIASQERLNTLQESGVATTRQLALAQANLIGAQRSLATAEEAAGAKAGFFTTALGRTVKMAGELGLIIGGIEIVKKAFEFVKAGKDLTDTLNSVQAAAQATDAQMKPVRATVLALGRDLTVPGATAVDAAKAIDDLIRSGMTLPRAMAAARSALLLVSVTNTDAALSARVLGDALDEFQLPASQAAHVATMLAAAATSTSGGLETVFEALQYSGTRARSAQIPMADLLATIVDLAKAGLQGTTIGTGLAMAISKLANPSAGGAKALKDLGIEAWDVQGKFKGLPYIVDQVFQAKQRFGGDSQRFLKDITVVFGARAANAIAAFSGKGIEGLDRFEKRLSSFDLQKAADLMNRGVGAGFRQLGKEATAAGIDVYQKFEPQITTAVMWIGTNLPKAIHEAQSALSPLEHMVSGVFAAGWHIAAAAVHDTIVVLTPVVHLLEDMKTPLSAIAILSVGAWAGFRGAQAASLLVMNLITMIRNVPAAIAGMIASAREGAASYVASWSAMGTSATVGAATTTAAMTDIEIEAAAMSGTVVAEGEAASIGWAGLLGPLGAVAVGVGLLVTMFHHSTGASKEATDAAKAYTEALSSSDPNAVKNTIIEQLNNANVPQTISELNELQYGMHQFKATEFSAAILQGGSALKNLRGELQASIAESKKLRSAQSNTSIGYALNSNAISKAEKLLADLNTQYSTLTKTQLKDLADTKAFAGVSSSIDKVAESTQVNSAAARTYAAMVGIVIDKNGIAAVSSGTLEAAVNKVTAAYGQATETGRGFLDALQAFSQSAGTAADRAAFIGATLKAANGDALAYASAMNGAATADAQLVSDIASGAAAVGKSGESVKAFVKSIVDLKTGTIDYSNAAAAPLINDLQSIQAAAMNAAQAQYQHEVATKGGKLAADDAYKTYVSRTQGTLIDEAKKLGLTKTQAQKLADQYFGMPKDVKTTIEQEGADPIVTVLNQIGEQLSFLTGHPWVPSVDANTKPAVAKVDDLNNKLDKLAGQKTEPYVSIHDRATAVLDGILNRLGRINGAQVVAKVSEITDLHRATGGWAFGPGTSTSDSIPAHLSKGEFVENAAAASKFGPLLEAINSGTVSSMDDVSRLVGSQIKMPMQYAKAARFTSGGAAEGSARSAMPVVYVQNPFTGEYLLAKVAGVADDRVGAAAREFQTLGGFE